MKNQKTRYFRLVPDNPVKAQEQIVGTALQPEEINNAILEVNERKDEFDKEIIEIQMNKIPVKFKGRENPYRIIGYDPIANLVFLSGYEDHTFYICLARSSLLFFTGEMSVISAA